MTGTASFSQIANQFLSREGLPEPVARVLGVVAASGVGGVSDAIPVESEETSKRWSITFFYECIRWALEDHDLTEQEMLDLSRLKRILRIREGDLVRLCPSETTEVLGQQLGRILEDRRVDPVEALHKVKLQELFGLSYDEFVEITAPVIDQVLVNLAKTIDQDGDGVVREEDLEWYHRSLSALDTAYGRTPQLEAPSGNAGFLYLLANASMPGLYKIGKTTRDPRIRTAELASATGVPTPFVLLFSMFARDCHRAEQLAHETFVSRGCRVAENREFFAVEADLAISVIIESCASVAENSATT